MARPKSKPGGPKGKPSAKGGVAGRAGSAGKSYYAAGKPSYGPDRGSNKPKRGQQGKRGPNKGGGGRKVESRYLVPGERAITELLEARPRALKKLFLDEGRAFEAIEAQVNDLGVPIVRRTREELDALVGHGLARGIVAHAEPPVMHALEDLLEREAVPGARRRILLALDEVVDPGNLGAILRSAEFFGVVGVFWGKDRSAPLSPLAVRASAGASERLALGVVTNLARALDKAKGAGWWVLGTLPEGGEALDKLAQTAPDDLVLVMGGEERGMRQLTIKSCDLLARIERVGSVASLNVSVATAVTLSALGGVNSQELSADSD